MNKINKNNEQYDENNPIIKGYVSWYISRCMHEPTINQINNFYKNSYQEIEKFLNQGASIKSAFDRWDRLNNT